MSVFSILVIVLYLAGLVAFGIFVSRQEDSTAKTRVYVWVGVAIALLLGLFSIWLGGAVMIAACFYVADRQNRSRMWALLGLFFGPLALLLLVCLPKLEAGDSLSLNLSAATPSGADKEKP